MFFYLILVTSASVRLEPLRLRLHLWGLKSISTSQRCVIILISFFLFSFSSFLSFGIVFIHLPPPLTNRYLHKSLFHPIYLFLQPHCSSSCPSELVKWVGGDFCDVCVCIRKVVECMSVMWYGRGEGGGCVQTPLWLGGRGHLQHQ